MPKHTITQILRMSGDRFVRVQYGRGGLINCAWNDPTFLLEDLEVSDRRGNWFDIPLEDFKIIVLWAINPHNDSLQGLSFSNSPHFTKNLFRVAKWGKVDFFITVRGGFSGLSSWEEEKIRKHEKWRLSNIRPTRHSVTSTEFVEILESKGITFS